MKNNTLFDEIGLLTTVDLKLKAAYIAALPCYLYDSNFWF